MNRKSDSIGGKEEILAAVVEESYSRLGSWPDGIAFVQ